MGGAHSRTPNSRDDRSAVRAPSGVPPRLETGRITGHDPSQLGARHLLALQRSIGNAAVGALLDREPVVQRLPMEVKSFEGAPLDTEDVEAITDSVLNGLVYGDYGHVQLLLADLRVKDPKAWADLDEFVERMRPRMAATRPKRAPLGMGSWRERPRPIERNVHRFWAGGPMSEGTKANLLKMQEVVTRSEGSGTPWRQFLWTSSIVNRQQDFLGFGRKNPLNVQLNELRAAGIQIVDMDKEWNSMTVAAVGTGEPRTDVEEKGTRWTREAKADLDDKKYDKVKYLSDLIRLVAVNRFGGVYLDTDIGPGALNLSNNELYHTDPEGEIGHHAPPFRVPKDYQRVADDAALGDSAHERVARHADNMIPVLNYFLASRSNTKHLGRELSDLFERDDLTSGMASFGRLFVPMDRSMQEKPTPYAPTQQRVTPWAAALAWTTDVSQGEG
ncbi:glycosyltransferase [Pseudonocardia alaniniphila]|uniref:Glycosyl transferase-like sugar-binding protein n=1 Tax=Pseudonocardia alaniniphila TaxID=75291 RepID=A0ABS9TJK4_9PSEU|nr:glycosyltransferase [Pseudonocardia alaniniphila]MCH6168593.1 hypothetical protein [Pseudonocardia alaniniphila]